MTANDWQYESYVQPAQVELYDDDPLPPPPPLHTIPQGPPPPMPPEQLHGSPVGKQTYNFAEIRRQIDELAKSREDLRGYRFRMQRERKEISNIREQTGSKEGSALNQLRNLLHRQSIAVPREIEEILEQIEALRDQLGALEAEYEDDERMYTRREIEYSEQEYDMVERLGDVHSHYSPQSDFQQNPANGGISRKSLAAVTDSRQLTPQYEDTDIAPSKKALQLVLQANLNYDVQDQYVLSLFITCWKQYD